MEPDELAAESTAESTEDSASDTAPTGSGGADEQDDLTRTAVFSVAGPVELDVGITLGRIGIELAPVEGEGAEVTVGIRHDPRAQPPWAESVGSLLDWVGERFGSQLGTDLRGNAGEAVGQVRVEKVGNRIVVRAPKALPLRRIPLAVTVRAPTGSQLDLKGGAADVTVTGTAGRADISTGSGDVALDRADGPSTVRTGTGSIKLGPTLAGLQVRTGSGDVEASSVSGTATVATGTGDIWLGAVSGQVMVRSGSGDLAVAEAASGSVELITGSGEIRVGIRSGVTAEIDVSSGSGRVSSELDVDGEPPARGIALHVRARTGSGDATVTAAAP